MSEYFANDPECHDLLLCALRSHRVAGLGGGVPQGLLWVESRPRRLRPCGLVRSCGPVPFAVTACDYVMYLRSISFLYGFKYGSNCSNDSMPGTILGGSLSFINMKSAPCSIYIVYVQNNYPNTMFTVQVNVITV